MIEEMEASMQDLLNLQAFYARCKETPVEAVRGTGKVVDQAMIKNFGDGTVFSGENC